MAECIERVVLIETLKNCRDAHADVDDVEGCGLIEDVIWEIIEQASADVAPVVRCEGCVFSQSDGWVCGGTALMPQHRTFPNSFCSFGERKDGGDNDG
jgi:hypothetical protein